MTCSYCKELPANKYTDNMCSSCWTRLVWLKKENKKMSPYKCYEHDSLNVLIAHLKKRRISK